MKAALHTRYGPPDELELVSSVPGDAVFGSTGMAGGGHAQYARLPEKAALDLLLLQPWTSIRGGRRLKGGVAVESRENLELIRTLAGTGVLRPVVDSTFPIERIADAYRRAETGHKRGSVVVTVAHAQA